MKFKTTREKRAFRMGCAVGSKNQKRTNCTATSRPHKRTLFMDDFEYTNTGRIKGSYTVDGRFEPD